ncbi:hypothetical protein PENSPDRAFT_682506 [Peniophora sp. CONT]|nr:hypothetical protein PENSPDRAFT_682506 [Peniophora sp. CONT]
MASIRKRVPFKATDSDDGDNRILDEIEQEDVIESLRRESEKSTQQSLFMLRAIISLSIFLQVVALTQNNNPLDAFFARSAEARGEHHEPSSPIPLGPLFALLNITVLLDLALSDWTDYPWFFKTPPITSRVAYGLTAIMPVVCIITAQGVPNIVWSLFAGLVVLLDDFIRRMLSKGKDGLVELERSKYTAKGA